jgi:hypothetical protein
MKNNFLKKTFFIVCLFLFFSFAWATDSSEEKTESEIQKRQDTLMYGMESDITSLLSTLISEKDDMFSDKISYYKNIGYHVNIIEVNKEHNHEYFQN